MPQNIKKIGSDRPFYLIPVALGMTGVLFSTLFEDPITQGIIVLFCLAVPLFVGGNLLGRIHSDGLQKFMLFTSLIALTIGSIVVVSGLSESLVDYEYVSIRVGKWSQRLGMGSLLVGLLAVMYTMVRSEAIIDQVVDRFRHVADHISEGFVLVDQNGTIILVNRSILLSAGLKEEDLIGKNAWDAAKNAGIQTLDQPREQNPRATIRTFEFVWKRHGQDRHYQITDTPIQNQKRKKQGDLFIIRDVTEQHRLASRLEVYTKDLHLLVDEQTKRLRESKERQTDLLMQMNEGFLTADENYTVDFANAQLARILDLKIDQVQGRSLTNFVPPDERQRLKSALTVTKNDAKRTSSQDYQFMRDNGDYIPVKVSIAKARGEGPELDHFSLVVTDLREVKKMQYEMQEHAGQLEKANAHLRELDRAKDTLLSNVSHELRTPLATIDGYVEMFQAGTLGPTEGPQVGALNVMKRNLDRLTVLIHEMIEFSKMEIKGITLYETVFHLDKFIEESILSAHPAANLKDIQINTTTHDPDLSIWGDRDKLSQTLAILLSNAIKFSHDESSIEVFTALANSTDIQITIKDDGIGIEGKNLELIFQKFYQVDSSMTRHFEGTGIGLSIANNIAKGHGGHIDVESTLNQGAAFTVNLPNAAFGSTQIDQEKLSLENTSIYVVNANIEFRAACARLLSDMGAEVQQYHSGHESYRHAQEKAPDLVLFGETLPDLSGIEAIDLFKNGNGTDQIKLLLMMTRSPKTGETTSLDPDHVLWKPFTPYELLQQIRTRIHSHQYKTEAS